MEKEFITRIFATVNALEKCHQNSSRMLSQKDDQPVSVSESLHEQKRILAMMRRVANHLQIQCAASNEKGIYRLTQIFYGLNSMVRPEVMSTFQALASGNVPLEFSERKPLELH